jgi:hypothetical protein
LFSTSTWLKGSIRWPKLKNNHGGGN